jgi:hypothetical protein
MPAYKYMPNSHEMERAGRGICRAGEVKGTRDKILHYLYMQWRMQDENQGGGERAKTMEMLICMKI